MKLGPWWLKVILFNRRNDSALSHLHGPGKIVFFLSTTTTTATTKSLQSCQTLRGPIDSSPPGSPSLGFSRQEHWSELPFPSPMHESEKWKWSRSVMSDPQRPHGLQPTRLLHPWDFPGKSTGVGCHCLLLVDIVCKFYISFSSIQNVVWISASK